MKIAILSIALIGTISSLFACPKKEENQASPTVPKQPVEDPPELPPQGVPEVPDIPVEGIGDGPDRIPACGNCKFVLAEARLYATWQKSVSRDGVGMPFEVTGLELNYNGAPATTHSKDAGPSYVDVSACTSSQQVYTFDMSNKHPSAAIRSVHVKLKKGNSTWERGCIHSVLDGGTPQILEDDTCQCCCTGLCGDAGTCAHD